jgi:hypothetical protein
MTTKRAQTKTQDYVYTKSAVAGRLRRGALSVMYFQPITGRLIRITRGNFNQKFPSTRPTVFQPLNMGT